MVNTNCQPCVEASLEIANKEERDTYAILRRQTKHGSEVKWATHSIVVNNSKLCALLKDWLSGSGEDFPSSKIELYAPFRSLYYRRDRIQEFVGPIEKEEAKAEEKNDDGFNEVLSLLGQAKRVTQLVENHDQDGHNEERKLAQLLWAILIDHWKPNLDDIEEFHISGVISFSSLWTFFPPGELVVFADSGQVTVGKVTSNSIHQNYYTGKLEQRVYAHIVDWNGKNFVYSKKRKEIEAFDGVRRLTNLVVYPLKFHEGKSDLEATLVRRGRKFEELSGSHVMEYKERRSGIGLERIIVDAYAWYEFQGWDNSDQPVDGHASSQGLSDEHCLMAVGWVKGFDLISKEWRNFKIDLVEKPRWTIDAIDKLVLHADQKRLVLAFTRHKAAEGSDSDFDDFIPGKGKGVIMLLAGPPGVGKTLTAESVAENLKRPIYIIGADDLGTDAKCVERTLNKAMMLCAHWKAVLLIDEADVFMGERKTDSLKRNELVSVFLRLIEYYEGMMFLTTNRANTLDPAFRSRIDLILDYSSLDPAARCQVWKSFIQRLPDAVRAIEDADCDRLSEWACNGREIKSAVKTGLILAKSEKAKLCLEHLETVLKVRQMASSVHYQLDKN
ncbi:P-loop containing nucleoside triphosphate hydrolase protein [Xylaria digitata]|nr:P-loop containing nucleoside triphosphate hydrolase protein [Xylaria digitata]